MLFLILQEVSLAETFPKVLTDTTSEVLNSQLKNANIAFELKNKCEEQRDSLTSFIFEKDSIIIKLQEEVSRSKEIEKSQKSEIRNLKELIQIKDDKFEAYVSSSKKDSWKQNLKTFLINTFIILPASYGAGFATGYFVKK